MNIPFNGMPPRHVQFQAPTDMMSPPAELERIRETAELEELKIAMDHIYVLNQPAEFQIPKTAITPRPTEFRRRRTALSPQPEEFQRHTTTMSPQTAEFERHTAAMSPQPAEFGRYTTAMSPQPAEFGRYTTAISPQPTEFQRYTTARLSQPTEYQLSEFEEFLCKQKTSDKNICCLCKWPVTKGNKTKGRFGLLSDCNDIFCLGCIRTNAINNIKHNNIKNIILCPVCDNASSCIMASSRMITDAEEKFRYKKGFMESIQNINCVLCRKGLGFSCLDHHYNFEASSDFERSNDCEQL